MLTVDNNAGVVRMPWTLDGMFFGRYAVQSGKKIFDARWKRPVFEAIRDKQKTTPVAMVRSGRRKLWYFHDGFYWEADGLSADDVKALVFSRERKAHQVLQTAHSVMRAEEAGRPARMPIPTELRRAVYERDGGRCVECSSGFDLQYDHILPVSRGGATTLENLQLLCAECNRRKSDFL